VVKLLILPFQSGKILGMGSEEANASKEVLDLRLR